LTSAYGGGTLEQLARARSGLSGDTAKPRAGVAAGHLLDALGAGLTGRFSMIGRVHPAVSSEIVLPARDAAAAARIEVALLATDKDTLSIALRALAQHEGWDGKGVNVLKVGRERLGKARAIHARLGFSQPALGNPAVQRLLGTTGMDAFLAVLGGDRLALTLGPGAKARMVEIARGDPTKKPAPAANTPAVPLVTDAIAVAGARSLFYFVDLRQAVSLATVVSDNPRLQALTGSMRSAIPWFGGAAGEARGEVLTLDLTMPPSFFRGVGGVIQAAMMIRN
jgi:hypothetical protein